MEYYLLELNQRLKSHSEYFSSLLNSGGYVEYFIGWFGKDNIGATLEPKLLKSTAELNIAIGLDVYVGKK